MRRLVVHAVVLLAAAGARAEPPDTTLERLEHRPYIAPGVAFGERRQELAVTLGISTVTEFERGLRSGGHWFATGIRAIGLAVAGRPAAVEGLLFASAGGATWEFFPVGWEVGVGAAGNSGDTHAVAALTAIIPGLASRFELTGTLQQTLGTRPPAWLPPWTLGVRWGFDVASPTRERRTVTVEGVPK